MPEATLHILTGPYRDRSITVRQGEVCRFGRTDRADIALSQDEDLSDVHFQLDCSSESVRLTDLGSNSGTYVNGERHLEIHIRHGDIILAGRTQFRLGVKGEHTAPAQEQQKAPRPPATNPTRPYAKGIADDAPSVRWEALLAAVWSRQSWLLDYCRQVCSSQVPSDWQVMYLFAVLAEPKEVDQLLRLARTTELGPRRFQLLGALGHPRTIDELIVRLESEDAAIVLAAASAFTKITGKDIESDREFELATEGEASESAASGPVSLPDANIAADHWQQYRNKFSCATRWCRGFDVSQGASAQVLDVLDMESRFEASLRDHFHGRRTVNPMELWSFFSA